MDADCRIFLADDHEIFRTGLKSLIDKEDSLRVVGQAGDGEELLGKLKNSRCDLILLDLSMPKMDGMMTLRAIREKYPKVKVLVLTMHKDQEHFKYAMAHGAQGYLLKDDAFESLVHAVKNLMRGKTFVSPLLTKADEERRLFPEGVPMPSLEILTGREREILRLIATGMANKNIASSLKISIRTVETHRANLTKKLGIKTTAGLVKYSIAKGLI